MTTQEELKEAAKAVGAILLIGVPVFAFVAICALAIYGAVLR